MVSLTAIIRCKPGTADAVLEALVAVGAHVEANEPDTLAYVVTRSSADPSVLLTHERVPDRKPSSPPPRTSSTMW